MDPEILDLVDKWIKNPDLFSAFFDAASPQVQLAFLNLVGSPELFGRPLVLAQTIVLQNLVNLALEEASEAVKNLLQP